MTFSRLYTRAKSEKLIAGKADFRGRVDDKPETSEFWEFTLRSYPCAGVQPSVIALQDRFGADVNVLFWCCYVAAIGARRLTAEDFARADEVLDPWRKDVTVRLREIRDHIKNTASLWSIPGAAQTRGKVLGAEIESERIAQSILERLVSQGPETRAVAGGLSDAGANLRVYLDYIGVDLDDEVRGLVRSLLAGTFAGYPDADYSAALG